MRTLPLALLIVVVALMPRPVIAHDYAQWALHSMHVYRAWGIATTRGAGVRTCVVDTGVNPSADLTVLTGHNSITPGQPDAWGDDDGHGTFVASEIAGNGTWVDGVAPAATILSAKALAKGTGTYVSVDASVLWCIAQHVQVVNLSLGGGAAAYDGMRDALTLACAHGIAVSVAAGNAAMEHAPVHPATITNPCVIVSNAEGEDGRVTTFSNFWENERSLTAPGQNILADALNGGVTYMSGTSQAAPMTAGVLALLMGMGVSARAAVRIVLTTAGHPRDFQAYSHPRVCPRGDALDYGCGTLSALAAVREAQREGYGTSTASSSVK